MTTMMRVLLLLAALCAAVSNDEDEDEDDALSRIEPLVMMPAEEEGLSFLHWKEDNTSARMGVLSMNPNVTSTIRSFCQDVGLMNVFYEILDDPYEESQLKTLSNGQQWIVGPDYDEEDQYENDSDIRWVEVANEATFEEVVSLLGKAGMDTVFETLGVALLPAAGWALVGGIKFMVASHVTSQEPYLRPVPLGVVAIEFPLVLPPKTRNSEDAAGVIVHRNGRKGLVNFEMNNAMVISSSTRYSYGEWDFRENDEISVIAQLWLASISDDSVETIADYLDSHFPIPGDKDYLLSQSGRFWGQGWSFRNDTGRKHTLKLHDEERYCATLRERNGCSDLSKRDLCPRTCNVYLDDDVYLEYFHSNARDCSATQNNVTYAKRSFFQECRRLYSDWVEDNDWFGYAVSEVDLPHVCGLVAILVFLLVTNQGNSRKANQYRNFFLYLLVVCLRYRYTHSAEYWFGSSLSLSIVESAQTFSTVHPVTSTGIALVHFSTYWTMVAAWRAKTLRALLFYLLLFELPATFLNELAHYYDKHDELYDAREGFITDVSLYALDSVIRGYILPPILAYGYLLPKVVLYWGSALFLGHVSTQEL